MSVPDPKVDAKDADATAAASSGPADSSRDHRGSLDETHDFTPAPGAVSAPAMPLPAALGRYAIRGVLGQGGYGTVYVGHDAQLDRAVAIKVQRSDRAAGGADVQKFLQEARRVARLKHPGIVTIHDVGVQDDQVFIVADFVEGDSLRDWLKKHRPTWQQAAEMAAQIADALAHAHAQRTIHRDVKPANIIITAAGAPILVDFGLGLDEAEMTGAHRGMVAGTPAYMAPEQATGAGHRIDGRTDIYSLGIVLYEMLTGRLPFLASTTKELLRQVCDDEPQPVRQLAPQTPRELENICHKALAKRVVHRHTTAADFAEELRQVLRSATATAAAPPATMPLPAAATAGAVQEKSGAGHTPASSAVGSKTGSTERRRREAERRQVTVLYCDLADSAALAEQLDPEELHATLRDFQRTCAEACDRFGGAVAQSIGDGLLVSFGYPVAYEDAAQRAVRSGLAILGEMAQFNQRLQRERGLQVAVRVGIHTGQVVAGEMAGDRPGEPLSLVGEARTVVAGVLGLGPPDAVVVSAATFRLVGGFFECTSLGTHAVKGQSRPLEVHQVLGEKEARTRLDVAAPGGLTPLVGRTREIGMLLERWELVKESSGQVALLVGEPGIGKSRMLHEVRAQVLAEPGADPVRAVIEFRGAADCQNSGLNPVVDCLERRLGYRRELPAAEKLAKLEAALSDAGLMLDEAAPLFAALLSVPTDDRYPPLALTPERLKQKTLDVVVDWLRRSALRQPVLFVVEDLHWLDASTLELLDLLVEQCATERLFLVFTFRPEFTPHWSGAHVLQVALPRLNKRQVAEMLQRRTHAQALPAEVAEQVAARTDGVPLFVEECTNMLLESGLIREVEGRFVLTGALPEHAIPSTLQDLLMARLDRLGDAKEVAQLGATLGREFSHELLQAVAGQEPAVLEQAIAQLVDAELLFKKGRPPQLSYLFKHALIQDAAYSSLLKSKRQQYHQRIAEVLEQQFPETARTQPERLAQHFTEAGLKERAVVYWEKAGVLARERSANAEAIGHLTQGLALLVALPESPERDQQEVRLQIPLGTAYLSTRGYAAPEVGPCFHRARELCEKIGTPGQLLAVMWGNWAWHVVRGDFRLCMELGREAMELAGRLGDRGITMEALFMPGLTMLYRADFAGARDHCGRAVGEFEDLEQCRLWSAHTGQNSGVTHRCYLALALWHLGYADQALKVRDEMVARARQIKHPFSLGYALHHAGWLNRHCRLGRETEAMGAEAQAVGAEHGFAMWHATGVLYRAAGRTLQDRHAEALPQLEQGIAAYRATGAQLALPFYLSVLADAYGKSGRPDDGLRTLAEALAIADENEDLFQAAELHRQRGELHLARGAAADAEASFHEGIAIARRQGSKAWELRVTMSLCRMWRDQGRRTDAHELLSAIFGWFAEGFTTPDLIDAKAMLDTLKS